jgi:hypothetical protein
MVGISSLKKEQSNNLGKGTKQHYRNKRGRKPSTTKKEREKTLNKKKKKQEREKTLNK